MKKTPYWWATIDRAEKRGFFTDEEIAKAQGWTTCACGRQDNRIPTRRHNPFVPHDERLFSLGIRFFNDVSAHNFAQARTTLTKIEKRAAEVLAEVTK